MKNRYYPITDSNNNKYINICMSLLSTEISIIHKEKIIDYFRHIPLCYILMMILQTDCLSCLVLHIYYGSIQREEKKSEVLIIIIKKAFVIVKGR